MGSGSVGPVHCGVCGRPVPDDRAPCPGCGSSSRRYDLAVHAAARADAKLGLVHDSPAAPGKAHSINVQSGSGMRSSAELGPEGVVRISASGRPDVGTRGEPELVGILLRRLADEGSSLRLIDGASDSRGEDGLLAGDNQEFVLQVTAVPSNSAFWREVAQGSGSTQVPKEHAVAWLRDAVVLKAKMAEPEQTILAIDARHAGVLADPAIAELYRSTYSSPTVEYGFAQAWVVGPTSSNCTRL